MCLTTESSYFFTGKDFVEGKTTYGLLCVRKNNVLKSIFGKETDDRCNPKSCLTVEIKSLFNFRKWARCNMHRQI
jgi:hypothetical protein